MEFFIWMSLPQFILSYMDFTAETAEDEAAITMRMMLICIGVAAGLYLICLAFGGLGLQTMAKRAGIAHGWLGFLPFGNTYLAGKLAGESNVFGTKMKNAGLWCMLLEIGYVAMEIYMLVVMMMFYSHAELYEFVEYLGSTGETVSYWSFNSDLVAGQFPNAVGLLTSNNVLEIISLVWWLVFLFFLCTLYAAVFRKYYARSPYMMTFLCSVLPLRGFALFAVRKNQPVDYGAYVRRRMEEMQQRQQGSYGPYGPYGGYGNQGGYGGQGGYGNSGAGNAPAGGDDPFSEFSPSGGGDPFSEFGDKDGGEDS